jgi:purine-binding chemotaxis protein CheW
MQDLQQNELDNDMFVEEDEDRNYQANKYLLFNISSEVYGINISSVTEIIEMQKIIAVPDMPDFLKGVINLRGKVIPVMDMRIRFGMEEREHDDRTCIIIVNVNDSSLGFIVDTVAEVHDIMDDDIEPAPDFKGHEERNRYIAGLGKVQDEVKILLDVEKILNKKEYDSLKETA